MYLQIKCELFPDLYSHNYSLYYFEKIDCEVKCCASLLPALYE